MKKFSTGPYGLRMGWQQARIKAARALRERSAQQVAEASGMGVTTYKKIESGARTASDGELWQISRALDIDVNHFLRESHSPFEPFAKLLESTMVVGHPGSQQVIHTNTAGQTETMPLAEAVRRGLVSDPASAPERRVPDPETPAPSVPSAPPVGDPPKVRPAPHAGRRSSGTTRRDKRAS